MAFNLIQADGSLYSVNSAGGVSSALTLPTGVTLSKLRRPRMTRFGRYVIVANSPSRPLSVDDSGTVRPLTPLPPTNVPVLAGETGGSLSGAFLVKQTFLFLDAVGNVIAESYYGPLPANAVTISAQYLRVSNISISADTSAISATRLYRTTAGPGSAYFPWAKIEDNTQTVFRDDLSDAALQLIAAPSLGSAPDLTLVTEWKGRLFGVDRQHFDDLRYTEPGTMYGWNAFNTLPIAHVGDDRFGVLGLAPRRDVLCVGRQNRLVQVAGTSRADIRPIGTVESIGFLSQESITTYRDTIWFLWRDGVYQWDNDGIVCVSDAAKVRTWFTSNSYFNRAMFSQAFAVFDPITLSYRLFLASAGSLMIDRWVEYSLKTGKFYGPHKTLAFAPSSAFQLRGTDDQLYPIVGSREGFLSYDDAVRTDWGLTPVPMRVVMAGHRMDDPDVEKYFGQVSVFTEPEPGGTLSVTALTGDFGKEIAGPTMKHDLTRSRARLDRAGNGKNAVIVFENSQIGQLVTIYGYEIEPVHVLGRR